MISTFKLKIYKKLQTELWYTLRRYYVDKFFEEEISRVAPKSLVIDIGGKKLNKRGEFNIEEKSLHVKYANLDKSTEPDYYCDVSSIPVEDSEFDVAILGELLEHVPNPVEILKEAYRVTKPGGYLFITTPFMYHVHADPYDYARYTEQWYLKVLKEIGFKDIEIKKHGGFFSVLSNMIKLWAYELNKINKPNKFIKFFFHKFVFWTAKNALKVDELEYFKNNIMFSSNTTGYGVICRR